MRRRSARLIAAAAGITIAALSFALVALADKEKIQLSAADQAFARAAVLKKTDLGTVGTWTGGAVKPDLSSTAPCATFHPKQSDLVLTGAAATKFKQPGIEFDSEAQVLETTAMVNVDWQRTVLAPELLPCLRVGLAKMVGANATIVSVHRVAFPRITAYTAAIRVVLDVKAGTSPVPVRAFVDTVLVGRGRTEISLTTTALFVNDKVTRAAEARLALILASRAHA
jgi:hypothetical protein